MCYTEPSTGPPPSTWEEPKVASSVGNTSLPLALCFPLPVARLLLPAPHSHPGQEEGLWGINWGQGQGAQPTPLPFPLALPCHEVGL